MYQDYKDRLSAFHAHGVKCLIVGGYAVIFHAQPRFTKDKDVFIKVDAAPQSSLRAGRKTLQMFSSIQKAVESKLPPKED